MSFNIAIDGPAGAGKSTIAKRVAEKAWIYLCGHRGNVPGDGTCICCRIRSISADDAAVQRKAAAEISISIAMRDGEQQVYLKRGECDRI